MKIKLFTKLLTLKFSFWSKPIEKIEYGLGGKLIFGYLKSHPSKVKKSRKLKVKVHLYLQCYLLLFGISNKSSHSKRQNKAL